MRGVTPRSDNQRLSVGGMRISSSGYVSHRAVYHGISRRCIASPARPLRVSSDSGDTRFERIGVP